MPSAINYLITIDFSLTVVICGNIPTSFILSVCVLKVLIVLALYTFHVLVFICLKSFLISGTSAVLGNALDFFICHRTLP